MLPFNIFIDHADDEMLARGVTSYGNAVKEMLAANIFPGDMLLKNFGVTRHSRVVFYDYDEVCRLDEVNIRAMPAPRSAEEEFASEPWFAVGDNDFFPQQFESFVASQPKFREKFLEQHAELLQPAYWRGVQRDIARGRRLDVFPYQQHKRFCHRYRARCRLLARRAEASGPPPTPF